LRWLIDLLIVVMLVAGGYGGWWYYNHYHQQQTQLQEVHDALAMLHEQTRYHRAMGRAEKALGLEEPPVICHQWFGPTLPGNPFAVSDSPRVHPWLDIAPEGDDHNHPPDPVLSSPDQAQFWFNPQLEVFRARVPALESHRATLALYNRVNGTSLARLDAFDLDDPRYLARRPTTFNAAPVVADAAPPTRPSLVKPVVQPLPADGARTASAARTDTSPAPRLPQRPSLRDR
jgi:hypothetical protein